MSRGTEIGEEKMTNLGDTTELEEMGFGFQIQSKRACQNFLYLENLSKE